MSNGYGTPDLPSQPPAVAAGLKRLEEIRAARAAMPPAAAWKAPTSRPPQAPPASPGALDLLRALRRHLGLALGAGLILAALAGAATWQCLPASKYNAQAMLHVASSQPTVVFEAPDASNMDARSEFRTYQDTQTALITSHFVLSAALRNPEVAGLPSVVHQVDPIGWLAKHISVNFTGEVLTIGLSGGDPREIVKLVNAVVDAYMNEVVNVEHNRRLDRFATLKKVYSDYQESLKSRRDTLEKLAESAGSNDKETLAYKHQLSLQRLASTERELSTRRSELRQAKIKLAVLQEQSRAAAEGTSSPPAADAGWIEAALNSDPTFQNYQKRVGELQRTLARYQNLSIRKNDPAISHAQLELRAARAELEDYAQSRRLDLAAQRREASLVQSSLGDERITLREIEALEEYVKTLVAEAADLERGMQTFNVTTLDLESTQDEVLQAERAAEQVGGQVEALRVELEAPPRIHLIEKAEMPAPTGSRKQALAAVAAGWGTFAMVLFGVAWWNARGQRIERVDEVVHGLGMDLVGILPARPRRLQRRQKQAAIGVDRSWVNLLMESIDSARAMLMHVARNEGLRIVMIASAVKGEGKTSLACHLAISLARSNRRTLLIDCDLRCPSAHQMFEMEMSGPGVCDLLRGEAGIDEAVQLTPAPGLSLIHAGQCDARAIEALSQGTLQGIFDDLRDQYDQIIVDTAPILPVADTLQISQHVDAVLFSILREESRLPKVYAAYERLTKLGIRVIGAIVAGVRVDQYDSSYHYHGQGWVEGPKVD